jgi:7-cyano-7-deazaguanine synthase
MSELTSAPDQADVAVLVSGGVDSALLVARFIDRAQVVQPIYVRFGLVWETAEEAHLRHFLAALSDPRTCPLVTLDFPIADVYGPHWSTSRDSVPDDQTSDDAVYLPGRNVLLLAKSSVWCALHSVRTIALGTLKGNPFPDSSDEFFQTFGGLAGLALSVPLKVVTPFAHLSKADVLAQAGSLELSRTFSCINPKQMLHCGRCNKCGERRRAFAEAGIPDFTEYAEA